MCWMQGFEGGELARTINQVGYFGAIGVTPGAVGLQNCSPYRGYKNIPDDGLTQVSCRFQLLRAQSQPGVGQHS